MNAAPVIQAFVATQLLIFLMSLIFSYEELFGDTPEDEPVKLSESEITQLKQKVKLRKS